MKILISGGYGFLGKHIRHYLENRNFLVDSIGTSDQNQIVADLVNKEICLPHEYDIVIHAAGKAHQVPANETEAKTFSDVNVQGTLNFLKALEKHKLPASFIFISSVAVYGLDAGSDIPENVPLNATTPYGKSKVEGERIVSEWCQRNKVICTILRLPLVAGFKPPGNLGNMIEAIKKGYYFNIDNGKAKKSMVLAEDVAKCIPMVFEKGGTYNLTDGYHPSFSELSKVIAGGRKIYNMPRFFAKILAKAGDMIGSRAPLNSLKMAKITSTLTFDDSKARSSFGWNPSQVLDHYNTK